MQYGKRARITLPTACVGQTAGADNEAWQCVVSWLRDRFKLAPSTQLRLRDEDGAELTTIDAIESLQHVAIVTTDPAAATATPAAAATTQQATTTAQVRPAPRCREHRHCAKKCHGASCLLRCSSQGFCVPCPLECNVKGRRGKGSSNTGCPITCSEPEMAENEQGWHSFSVPFFPPGHASHPSDEPPLELPQAHKRRGEGGLVELAATCAEHGLDPTDCTALGAALQGVEECMPTCLGVSFIGGPRHALESIIAHMSIYGNNHSLTPFIGGPRRALESIYSTYVHIW